MVLIFVKPHEFHYLEKKIGIKQRVSRERREKGKKETNEEEEDGDEYFIPCIKPPFLYSLY